MVYKKGILKEEKQTKSSKSFGETTTVHKEKQSLVCLHLYSTKLDLLHRIIRKRIIMSHIILLQTILICCGLATVLSFQVTITNPVSQIQQYRSSFITSSRRIFPSTSWSNNSALYMNRPGGNRGGKRYAPRQEQVARPTMNDEVPDRELRVVTPSPNGKDVPLGVMTKKEALAKAAELGGLDLILINQNSDPPVCKIVDYSKYRYMLEKKAKAVKKNSKASELKEIKMSYQIDIHDYNVRKNSAVKFIQQGNRVKCTIMFRGREMQHDKLGYELLEKLAVELNDLCLQEGKPTKEGRNLSLMLTPKPEVLRAVNEARKAAKKTKIAKMKEDGVEMDDDDDEDEDDDDDDEDYDDDLDVPVTATPVKRERTLEEILGTTDYL